MEQTLFGETEVSLIEQARLGDSNAFGELVRNHYPSIVTILYRLCGDEQLAEDATQEAFIKAWVKLPSYHPQAPLRYWLYRIAVNTAHDLMRRRSDEPMDNDEIMRAAEQSTGAVLTTRLGDPETALIEKEQSSMLQRALYDLPEASRAVLVLREYGDLSYQEIAHVLDIPIGTVMSRLNYARNRLQSILQEQTLKMENAYV